MKMRDSMNNKFNNTGKWYVLLMFMVSMPTLSIEAQEESDPTLFWIEDQAVPTSEFVYIYNKNNGGTANYDEDAVREYLNLYENFKLKVYHARQMKLDTIPRLKKELAGYREQLASTYLNDNGVMGRLASEAYKRMQKEAEVSHILIRTPKNAMGADTLEAYEAAQRVYTRIKSGDQTFEEAAKSYSQDDKNKNEGGYIGFVKAILPRGYYELETAIYNLSPGEISKPVRSPRGYHIVRLKRFRPARKEVEVAHILIKKDKKDPGNEMAKRKINDIHNRLAKGVPFQEIAAKESDDDNSARKGGRVGYIQTGEYDPEFEEAVFALTEDGQISEPVETRIGFHILKRLGVKEDISFNDSRRRIENELRRTEREEIAQDALLKKIKTEEKLVINQENKLKVFNEIDESVKTYRWEQAKDLDEDLLLTYGNGETFHTSDFATYLEQNPKERVNLSRMSKINALALLFDNWVKDICFELEKEKLEEKYPDFAALMREYEEGILLFEITKENVWDRASADTAGLKDYFNNHRGDYVHPAEIDVITYTIAGADKKSAKKISRKIKKLSPEEMAETYPRIPQDERTIKKTDELADEYKWSVGGLSHIRPLGDTGSAFLVSETMAMRPERQKELSACRGYVIADYQEELENVWLKELKSRYKIKENKDAIEKLISDQ